jgi:rare lipoprotein A
MVRWRIHLFPIFPVFCIGILLIFLTSCSLFHRYPDSGNAVASWYGAEFHGKPTSSGEIFNMYAFTCAHREYPFGTKLKVTNIVNSRTVHCLVNDRGPFVSGRDLDLSYAAAREIGLIGAGTAKVWVEYLGRDNSYIKEVRYISDAGPFTVQVGSFREISNAERLKTALELKYRMVYIAQAQIQGSTIFRVRLGRFPTKEDVSGFARSLAYEGYSVYIAKYEEKI